MQTETMDILKKVIDYYNFSGTLKEVEPCVNGHINDTYHVKFALDDATEEEYIFQRINDYVFKEPVKIMSKEQQGTASADVPTVPCRVTVTCRKM